MSEWISVEDRLPDLAEDILTIGDEDFPRMHVSYLSERNPIAFTRAGDLHRYYVDVTHWMPLPSPPEKP